MDKEHPAWNEPAEDRQRFEEGGDPVCWAHLACPECGAIISDGHRAGCATAQGDPSLGHSDS
jgi:hypothetical protein